MYFSFFNIPLIVESCYFFPVIDWIPSSFSFAAILNDPIPRSFDYYMEIQLHLLGYKIIYDEEDAYIVLKGKEGEFEITQEDIEKLSEELKSFLNFKIFDLMQNSRKFGK